MEERLQKFIDEKYISVQKHPTEDLYIYNYTQRAQFDRVWTEETMMCRGLILNGNGDVIARPFKKFFNLQEAIDKKEELPLEDFVIQEKYDGSLGILYWVKDEPYITTRGSFTSDQAIEGNKMLQMHRDIFDKLNREFTYLFEIIYPENRIVVDYAGRRELILLAVIDTKTGEERDPRAYKLGFPCVRFLDGIVDYNKLSERAESNKEGYVIRFKSGKRYKVKFDEYVRLHRLITGVNARRIWDMLRANQPLDELLERVPDEFFAWVSNTKKSLENDYAMLERTCLEAASSVEGYETRKDQAIEIMKNHRDISGIVFSILDKKDYSESIWRILKPKHELPFKLEV